MDIFPHYRLENETIVDFVNNCNTLSNVCLKCIKFKNKLPCVNKKNQIAICPKGMSVFWDIIQGKQYFSLRIRKNYNSFKIKCNDESFKISEIFFKKYISYISKDLSQEFLQIASVFFDNIAHILDGIYDIINAHNNADSGICYFLIDEIFSLNELMDKFACIRQETAALVDKIEPLLSTLFFSENIWNVPVDSCLKPFYICQHCIHKPCFPVNSDVLEECHNGICRYAFKNVIFRGICVNNGEGNSNSKDQLELTNQYAIRILREEAWLISSIIFFQRFLHDVAQYFVGIRGLIPEYNSNDKQYCIRQQDVFTISVLYDAITTLRYNIYCMIFSVNDDSRITFEPYKLFDKYRICFTDTSKVKIQIPREQNLPITTAVIGFKGFELAILNLLLNAIKYLPPTPFPDREVKIRFILANDLEIHIDSYGPPILDDEISHLGEVGYRGSYAKRYKISGKGLGLNLIKELCCKNGYLLTFKSNIECKITFKDKEYAVFSVILTIPHKYHCRRS